MILHIYTIIHTLISLVAIFTGFVVLFGLLAGKRLDSWTKWFLITAVATTVTGFFFSVLWFHASNRPRPHIVACLSSYDLRALLAPARRPLALDLCGRRFPYSLFQCLCRNRAVVRKNPGAESDGADTKRAAI